MQENINKIINIVVYVVFIFLLFNIVALLFWNSWQGCNGITCNTALILQHILIMIFCLIFLIKDRIIKLTMSSDGVSAELQKIEKAKEEIFATKEEIIGIKMSC